MQVKTQRNVRSSSYVSIDRLHKTDVSVIGIKFILIYKSQITIPYPMSL